MKILYAELLESNVQTKLESKKLTTGTSEEFIEALVLLCNGLDVDVPLWTHREEKMLEKKNEVVIPVDPEKNIVMKIYTHTL
jgi:hypothetical protein